eukprot:XP_011669384.1 PREDICTED: uncharacterized protein LOC105440656 [Strongylocentrotus purpuratus]
MNKKCFERIILKSLLQPIRELIDPHQYAYQQNKSVQDATLYLTHLLYKHTEETKSYVRALFVDFSSAFNTIRPHVLVEKLKRLEVRPSLILWIVDFLQNRTQKVRVQNTMNHAFENIDDPQKFADELNMFYCRFDTNEFIDVIEAQRDELIRSQDESLRVEENDVSLYFSRVNPRKAMGPDNISGKLLRNCARELATPFRLLFQTSLDRKVVPVCWKTSTIIPVAKKSRPSELNDYRPVALTPIAMNSFERIILKSLLQPIRELIDPHQYAYQQNKSVQDATLYLTHLLYKHTEETKSYVRALFVDFSSAFNTIRPHVLVEKLKRLEVRPSLILWIVDFLQNRTQQVREKNTMSESIVTNIGSPQGCVLSAILFVLYTNDCRSSSENVSVLKYADDTVIVGNIRGSETEYEDYLNWFTEWCNENFLDFNTTKTKEMIIDFRKSIKQKGGNRSGDSTTKRADPSKISKTADQESSGSATIEFGSIKQKGGNRSGDSTTNLADPSKISKTADQESSGSATIEFGSIKQKGGNRSGDSTTKRADPSKISKTADQESSGSATIEFGLTGVLRHTRRLVLQDVRSSSSFRLRRGGKKSGRNTVIRGDAGLELHVIKWMSIDDETHLVLRDAYFLGDDISILAPLCPTVKHFSIDFHTIRLLPFTLMSTHMRVPMRSVITVCIKSLYCLGNLQETLSEVGNLFPDAQILDMQIGILNSPSDQAYSHEVYSSSSLRELKLRFEGRYDITTDNLLMDISTSCPNIVSLVLSGFGRCPSNKSGKEITSCKMLHLTKIHLESFGTDNRHRFETLTSIFYVFHVISPRLRFVEAKKVQLGGAEFASAKWSRTSSGYELQLEDASSAVPMADLMHLVSNELEEVTVLTFDRCNVDIPQSISHPPHSTREESSLQELKFLNVECPLSQTDINKLSEMYPYVQITVKHESQASHEDSKQGTSMPFKLKWKTSPSSPTSSMDEVNVVPIKMECCKRVGVKGGKLQLDSFGIELEIPPGAIDSEAPQDISLRVLTDTQNLGNNKEEMSVCFGVQCLAPDDLVLKLPVTYTIPHCAVITRYSSVKAVLYTGEGEYSPGKYISTRIEIM